MLDFSVIILCYNPNIEKLKSTIISIVKQVDVSFEIVIADDGSSTNYKEEIKKWVDDKNFGLNFKYCFAEKNKGTVWNYYNGLKHSSGEYIKPISPGDYLLNQHSLKTYKNAFLESNDVVFSDSAYYFDDHIVVNKTIPSSKKIFTTKKLKKEYCYYGEYFVGATIAVKKQKLLEILENALGVAIFSEDLFTMLFSFFENYNIKGIDEELVFYEYGEGISTTNKGRDRLIRDNENVYDYFINKYVNDPLTKKMRILADLKSHNNVAKLFIMVFSTPDYFIRFVFSKIRRPLKTKATINELKDITSLEAAI